MSSSTRTRVTVASALAALAGASLFAGPQAGAAAPPEPTVVADGLTAPLSIATDGETVYYNNGFGGLVFQAGVETPIVSGDKEVEGLSLDGADLISTQGKKVVRRTPEGDVTVLASLFNYEKANNPDGDVNYGLASVSDKCKSQWPTHFIPPKYSGIVESHPYGTAVDGSTVYVADAAANAILAINGGSVSTVAVLPPVKATITKAMAKEDKLPDCAIGKTFKFEGVPTDVEVGPNGLLYVSSLPGGEVAGKGRILTVDPETGETTKVLGGLSGATGVAVDANGDIYAANLFAGAITVKPADGAPSTFVHVPLPAAVEIAGNKLYVSTNSLPGGPSDPPAGQVVSFNLAN